MSVCHLFYVFKSKYIQTALSFRFSTRFATQHKFERQKTSSKSKEYTFVLFEFEFEFNLILRKLKPIILLISSLLRLNTQSKFDCKWIGLDWKCVFAAVVQNIMTMEIG